MTKTRIIGMTLIAAASWISQPIFAQSAESQDSAKGQRTLEEIVVTAARREEGLQDASMSVSALSGKTLSDLGAQQLDDYFGFVPSVNSASNTIGERGGKNIVMRGVSNTRIAAGPSALSSTTGYYLNDIPMTPVDTELFDVNRVEVLRGPQGTLYGAAAMGGTAKVILNQADLYDFGGAVEGTLSALTGGGPGGSLSALVNIPVFEGIFGVRVVGSRSQRDGFIDTAIIPLANTSGRLDALIADGLNIGRPGRDSTRVESSANAATASSASVSALYTPNDKLSVEYTSLWQLTEIDDNNFVNKRFNGDNLQEKYLLEPNRSEITLNALNVSYNFGAATLVSNTGFYTREYDEIVDWTQVTYKSNPAFGTDLETIPVVAVLDTQIDLDTFTQEIRIESDRSAFSDPFFSRLDWVLGAFLMQEDRRSVQLQDAPGWEAAAPGYPLPVPNDMLAASDELVQDESKAVFVDLNFHISERLTVGGGIRFFDLSTESNRAQVNSANPVVPITGNLDFTEDGNSFRFGAAYDLNDDTKFFATYSDGFRLGGAGTPINLSTSPLCVDVLEQYGLQAFADGRFNSDSVETTELGFKTAFADGRATLNVAAYHTDWSGLQQQVRLGDLSPVCFNTITANVGTAEVDGFEVELAALAGENFSLQASLAYTDAQVVDPGPGGLTDPGDPILNVPEWSGSLIARYESYADAMGGGTVFAQADLRYTDERQPVTGNSNAELALEDYTLLGARLGFVFGAEKPTTVTLWGKNLLDQNVDLNARNRIGVSNVVVNRALPRTYGITIRKDF